jgi:plastocyanin
MSTQSSVSRRRFLRGATGAAAVAGVAVASGGARAQTTVEVAVGPGGSLVYEPAELYIQPGTEVRFVWESDNHNIVVEKQPEGAGWSGSEGGAGALYNEGHESVHTFETIGEYEYYCTPHRSAGMVATIIVNESGEAPAAADAGSSGPPPVPDAAKSLGVATIVGLFSTLGLAYFFLRYGGNYELED